MKCTVCYTNDPAVASGMVDLEIAGVVMSGMSHLRETRQSRRTKTTNARWLTSKIEAERARSIAKEKQEKEQKQR